MLNSKGAGFDLRRSWAHLGRDVRTEGCFWTCGERIRAFRVAIERHGQAPAVAQLTPNASVWPAFSVLFTISAIADLVGCVATSKRTITPIADPTQTQLDIHPNLADKSLQSSIDARWKTAILLKLGTMDDALDCSEDNHNAERNRFRLESHAQQNGAFAVQQRTLPDPRSHCFTVGTPD